MAEFQNTLDMLDEFRFDVVHVAMYSPRPGTVAATEMVDDVPREEKRRRLHEVEQLQTEIATRINAGYLGRSVDVLVDAGLAPLVVAEVGQSTVRQRRDDGAVVVRLEVTNVAMLRSWVLELGEHAEVLGPESVRGAMVSWLEATAAGTTERAVD